LFPGVGRSEFREDQNRAVDLVCLTLRKRVQMETKRGKGTKHFPELRKDLSLNRGSASKGWRRVGSLKGHKESGAIPEGVGAGVQRLK